MERDVQATGSHSEERSGRLLQAALLSLIAAGIVLAGPPDGEQPPPRAEVHLDPALLHNGVDLWQKASPEMKAKAVQLLRERLRAMREPIKARLAERVAEREQAADNRISAAMAQLAQLGWLLLLMPFILWRHYPGKFVTLAWNSLLAAGLFFITFHLFALPLVMFFSVTLNVTEQLDPRLHAVDPVFDLIDRNAEYLLQNNLPIGPALEQMESGQLDSFLTLLLDNLVALREQARVFVPLLHLWRRLEWLTGPLLHLQTLLIVTTFLFSVYPVFVEIVRLPLRAAAGEEKSTRRILKLTLRNWWGEIVSVLAILPLFVILAVLLEVVLDTLSQVGTEAMLDYVIVTLEYLGHEARPAFWGIYLSLACVAFFFFFNAGVAVLASWSYLTGAQRVFRLRFHEKVPLWEYAPFWRQATLALAWVLVLPVLFTYLAVPWIHKAFVWLSRGPSPHYLAAQLVAGFLLVAGILVVFRLAYGFAALRLLVTMHVPQARVSTLTPESSGIASPPEKDIA